MVCITQLSPMIIDGLYSFSTSLDLVHKHLALPLAARKDRTEFTEYFIVLKNAIASISKEIPKEVNFLTNFPSKKENK